MCSQDSLQEINQVRLNWLNVMDEFHDRHDRLNQLIGSVNSSSSYKTRHRMVKLRKLFLLREHVNSTVATLLMDMMIPLPTRLSSPPSMHTKLKTQTSMLDELNRKIDVELDFIWPIAQA